MDTDRSSFVANEFLMRFIADREAGRILGIDDYVRLFPGHEATVREEYDHLHARSTGDRPAMVGAYVVEGEIGRGGQAVVRRARHRSTDRRVALKTIRCDSSFDFGDAMLRLRREARALQELDHPGICPILEFGRHEHELFIVMPLLEGRTLSHSLTEGTLSEPRERQERAVAWTRDVADALQHAHAHGVVHRDVKPGNIMIVADRAVLFDFGAARWTDGSATTLTDEGDLIGTPAFMAPELIASARTTPRSDVFALGVTLFWGLTGKRPFEGRDRASLFRAIAQGDFDAEALRRAKVDPHLVAVVRAALQPDPYDRYESAAAMRDDLRSVQLGEPPRVLRHRLLRSLWRWARSNAIAAVFLALLVSGATAAAGFGAYLRRGAAAYRTAAESQALRDFDFALTDAFAQLWEGRVDEAGEAFLSLRAREDPIARRYRPEVDLGLRSLGLSASGPSAVDESPPLRAFASAHAFLVAAQAGASKADAARATRDIEAACFLTTEPRLRFDVARVFVARWRADLEEATRAAEGLSSRWPDHRSLELWRAMAYETAAPRLSVRLHGDRPWGAGSAERMLDSILAGDPAPTEPFFQRLREVAEAAPRGEAARWSAILARISEGR